jgi:hypothetical protein
MAEGNGSSRIALVTGAARGHGAGHSAPAGGG